MHHLKAENFTQSMFHPCCAWTRFYDIGNLFGPQNVLALPFATISMLPHDCRFIKNHNLKWWAITKFRTFVSFLYILGFHFFLPKGRVMIRLFLFCQESMQICRPHTFGVSIFVLMFHAVCIIRCLFAPFFDGKDREHTGQTYLLWTSRQCIS